jgi:pilus assembly protein CpaF
MNLSHHPEWLDRLLCDSSITDLSLTSHQVTLDRGNGMEILNEIKWNELELKNWLIQVLSKAGKSWDAKNPYIDASVLLPDEFRLHAVFPPVSCNGIIISLRRLPQPAQTPRWISDPLFSTLSQIVQRGETVIISGSTGSGKTTLASELLSTVSKQERIISLEDTRELAPHHPQHIPLLSRAANADGFGEVTLRQLLKQTLRMRPDRIILGECRGPEVLELLQALNTGHRGTLATLHANSPREALRRIELLCLLSSGGVLSLTAIRELLALGVQWIVQVERTQTGRLIKELSQVAGREGETLLLRPFQRPHPSRLSSPLL